MSACSSRRSATWISPSRRLLSPSTTASITSSTEHGLRTRRTQWPDEHIPSGQLVAERPRRTGSRRGSAVFCRQADFSQAMQMCTTHSSTVASGDHNSPRVKVGSWKRLLSISSCARTFWQAQASYIMQGMTHYLALTVESNQNRTRLRRLHF